MVHLKYLDITCGIFVCNFCVRYDEMENNITALFVFFFCQLINLPQIEKLKHNGITNWVSVYNNDRHFHCVIN